MLFKSYDEYLLTALKDSVNAEEYWQREMGEALSRATDPDNWFRFACDADKAEYLKKSIEKKKAETATMIAKAHGLFDEKFRLWCPWNQYGILITDVGVAHAYTFTYDKYTEDGNTVFVPILKQCNRINSTQDSIEIFGASGVTILKDASERILERFKWMPEVPEQPVKEEQAKDLKCDRAKTEMSQHKYQMLIQWSDDHQCYVVILPDFPDLSVPCTEGNSYEEAAKKGKELLDSLIEWVDEKIEPLPQPKTFSWRR